MFSAANVSHFSLLLSFRYMLLVQILQNELKESQSHLLSIAFVHQFGDFEFEDFDFLLGRHGDFAATAVGFIY